MGSVPWAYEMVRFAWIRWQFCLLRVEEYVPAVLGVGLLQVLVVQLMGQEEGVVMTQVKVGEKKQERSKGDAKGVH